MKLIEFINILRQFYSNHVDVEVYYKCPCCGKCGTSTVFELYESDLKYSFINSKVLTVYYHENKLEIEVESC